MAKIVKVTDGDYKVIVRNGATGTITLDTTAGASTCLLYTSPSPRD